jgi:hypothetical protein
LVVSVLLFAAALIPLALAAVHWRYAARLAPDRPKRRVHAWRVVGTAYGLWGLALLCLGSLSLMYPTDGRQLLLPPEAHVGRGLEILAYALVPTGALVVAIGTAMLR